jgi:type IV pilus assembly protein PilA
MKSKKGFTLIELLAVIVILAIILVIAVPQILKVIQNAKQDSFASSAKMIASAIETEYLTSQSGETPKTLVASWTACDNATATTDYGDAFKFSDSSECTFTLTSTNNIVTAKVRLVGSGKFASLWAKGTRSDVTVTTSEPATGWTDL